MLPLVQASNQIDAIELLNRVNTFYESGWQHLLYLVGIVVTVAVVLIPIAIQIYQRQVFKAEGRKITEHLNAHADKIAETLKEQIATEISNKLKEEAKLIDQKLADIAKEMDKRSTRAQAGIFFVQGMAHLNQKAYPTATVSLTNSASESLRGSDQMNLQRALKQLTQNCLPNLKKADLSHPQLKAADIQSLIDELKLNNHEGQYSNYIIELEQELQNAENR